jgi:prolyl-tRNA synthetase
MRAGFGSLGPVGLPLKVYADPEITRLYNFSAANQTINTCQYQSGPDFISEKIIDVRNAEAVTSVLTAAGRYIQPGIEAGLFLSWEPKIRSHGSLLS